MVFHSHVCKHTNLVFQGTGSVETVFWQNTKHTYFCGKFIQDTVCQILSESAEFCR